MNALQIIVIIIALLGYPAGLLIAWLAYDELEPGRKWFKLIILACVLAIILSLILARGEILFFLVASFIFVALIALASLIRARVKKLRKKIKRIEQTKKLTKR